MMRMFDAYKMLTRQRYPFEVFRMTFQELTESDDLKNHYDWVLKLSLEIARDLHDVIPEYARRNNLKNRLLDKWGSCELVKSLIDGEECELRAQDRDLKDYLQFLGIEFSTVRSKHATASRDLFQAAVEMTCGHVGKLLWRLCKRATRMKAITNFWLESAMKRRCDPYGVLQFTLNAAEAENNAMVFVGKRALKCEFLERAIRMKLGKGVFQQLDRDAEHAANELFKAYAPEETGGEGRRNDAR